MPAYYRRQIKAEPGYWELNEVMIITPDQPQSLPQSQTSTAHIIRKGLLLAAPLVGALATRYVLPIVRQRLAATRKPRLAAPRQLLLEGRKKE